MPSSDFICFGILRLFIVIMQIGGKLCREVMAIFSGTGEVI